MNQAEFDAFVAKQREEYMASVAGEKRVSEAKDRALKRQYPLATDLTKSPVDGLDIGNQIGRLDGINKVLSDLAGTYRLKYTPIVTK